MNLSDDKRLKFSGHQTFTFRYGWLEKGITAVDASAECFGRDDAIVVLGVGKNMVRSIHHWCQVSQLLEQAQVKGKKDHELAPSSIARKLFLQRPWDPFLEDDASLWLIHWL